MRRTSNLERTLTKLCTKKEARLSQVTEAAKGILKVQDCRLRQIVRQQRPSISEKAAEAADTVR